MKKFCKFLLKTILWILILAVFFAIGFLFAADMDVKLSEGYEKEEAIEFREEIHTFIKNTFNNVKVWCKNTFENAKNWCMDVGAKAKQWFSNKVEKAKLWCENNLDDVKLWFASVVDDAKNWCVNAVEDVKSWCGNKIEDVKLWWGNVINNVKVSFANRKNSKEVDVEGAKLSDISSYKLCNYIDFTIPYGWTVGEVDVNDPATEEAIMLSKNSIGMVVSLKNVEIPNSREGLKWTREAMISEMKNLYNDYTFESLDIIEDTAAIIGINVPNNELTLYMAIVAAGEKTVVVTYQFEPKDFAEGEIYFQVALAEMVEGLKKER